MIALLVVGLYFFSLTGVGFVFVRNKNIDPIDKILSGLLIGSAIAGLLIFFITQIHVFYSKVVIVFFILSFIISLSQVKNLYNCLNACANFFKKSIVKQDKWSPWFLVVAMILITWLFLLTNTPPRAADAMRYHLPVIKDFVIHHGDIVRPYIHYNFPNYFNLIFSPVFFLSKGVGLKIVEYFLFLLSVFVVQRISFKMGVSSTRFLFLLLFFIPLDYQLATIAHNDWAVIFYILTGLLFLLRSFDGEKRYYLYLSFLSLGISLGIKYQAIVFIPWFIFIGIQSNFAQHGMKLRRTTTGESRRFSPVGINFNSTKTMAYKKLDFIGPLLVLAFIACPFYIRNIINFHNPFWPLAQSFFSSGNSFIDTVSLGFQKTVTGHHDIYSIVHNIKSFLSYPLVPPTIWFLGLAGCFCHKKNSLKIGLGVLLYFIIWWLVQPVMYMRLGIYILPILAIGVASLYERLIDLNKKTLIIFYKLLVAVSFLYFIPLFFYYSGFYLKYHITKDGESYHKYTWYYDTYSFSNENLAKDKKVLVIVRAGQTYYLDRPYLRADPNLSGLIDWRELKNLSQLLTLLKRLDIHYIIYDNNLWENSPGGANMVRLMGELRRSRYVGILYDKKIKLYSSRILEKYDVAHVLIINLT